MSAPYPKKCPPAEALERSYWSRDRATDDHRAVCATCAARWAEIEELAELSASLESPTLPADRREQLRVSVLASASKAANDVASRRRPIVIAAALVGLAAGAVLYLGLRAPGEQPTKSASQAIAEDGGNAAETLPTQIETERRARVTAIDSRTRFTLVSSQPDEVVRLTHGAIDVEVTELAAGERFRVVVGDSEVEVRGTLFRVTADSDKLLSVEVIDGQVEVRVPGRTQSLGADQRWDREPHETSIVRSQPKDDSQPRLATPRTTKKPAAKKPAIEGAKRNFDAVPTRLPSHFEIGWEHLRRKHYAAAASAFEKAVSSDEGLNADALYWAGVSQFRAGRKERARVLLRRFFRDKKGERRHAEVAVMLGWIEVDRRAYDVARELFTVGLDARSKKVRHSAQEGLRAIGTRR